MESIGFNLSINKRLITKFSDKFFLDKRFIAGTLVPNVLDLMGFERTYSHCYGSKFFRYPSFEELKKLKKENLEFGTIDSLKDKNIIGIQLDNFLKYNSFINERDPYKLGIIMHLVSDLAWDKLPSNIVSDLSTISKDVIEDYTYLKHNITIEEIENIYGIIDSVFPSNLANYLQKNINLTSSNRFNSEDLSNKKHLLDLYNKIDKEYMSFQKKLTK